MLINQSIDKAVAGLPITGPVVSDILKQVRAALIKELGDDVWYWYRLHEHDVIWTIREKVWFIPISIDVRVRHAKRIFEEIAGPEPVGA